jgi:amino acid transporter
MMVAETELRPGALGLVSLIAQGLTHVAPAMGFLTGATFIATYAGTSIPLAYLGAFILCLSIAISLIQLAKHLPSAGGYFTYVSRTLSPRFGFITAWLYFLYDPTVAAINFAIVGIIFEQVLRDRAGITFPWWATVILGTALVIAIIYRGVRLSGKLMIVLSIIEVGILLLFSFAGFFVPGPGGVNTVPIQLDPNYPIDKVFVGIVFAIFAFTGFEAVAPMAEESANPRRYLPMAIIISLVLMGIFYVVASFGLVIGWGTDTFDKEFAGGSVSTFMDLAVRLFGGWGWILLFLAILNSAIAVGIAGGNAASRVWFSMGRAGALPAWLGYVHPTHKTPTHAILLYGAVTLLLAILGSWLFGQLTKSESGFAPDVLFYWFGIAITLGLIGVYGLGNIGVIRFYLTERRDEFNVFWHLIVPAISTLAILAVGYYSLQGLGDVFFWAPVFVAVWVAVGVVILIIARLTGREEWFLKAGVVAYERQASPEEVAGAV